MELISIIVPVYNVEEYIEQALDSLINQTYKNIEIIIIDDGSTDNSAIICEKYAEEDKRIVVIHTANNGVAIARNLGINLAKGEYIGFVDPDDYINLDMFEKLYGALKECKADIACCRRKNFGIENSVGGYYFSHEKKILSKKQMMMIYAQSMDWSICNKLYKSNIIKSYFFPENIKFGEDFFTVFKWISLSDKIVYLQEPLYFYRMGRSGSQTTSDKNLYQKVSNSLTQLMEFKKYIVDLGDKELLDIFQKRYIRSLFSIRCNAEKIKKSHTKNTLVGKIESELSKNSDYFYTLSRSKQLKLYFLLNFNLGYKFIVVYEKAFKGIDKKLRNLFKN